MAAKGTLGIVRKSAKASEDWGTAKVRQAKISYMQLFEPEATRSNSNIHYMAFSRFPQENQVGSCFDIAQRRSFMHGHVKTFQQDWFFSLDFELTQQRCFPCHYDHRTASHKMLDLHYQTASC